MRERMENVTFTSFLFCYRSTDIHFRHFKMRSPLATCQQSNQCLIPDHFVFTYFFIWEWRSVTSEPTMSFFTLTRNLRDPFKPSYSIQYEFFTSLDWKNEIEALRVNIDTCKVILHRHEWTFLRVHRLQTKHSSWSFTTNFQSSKQ